MLHSLEFRLLLAKRKAFADIHRNVGVVRSFGNDSTEKDSNCKKPVITWPLGCLANLSPSGAFRPRGHVITSTYYI